MERITREELESAFRSYWRTGAVNEDWDGFANHFTEDARYVEHVLGDLNGREQIRSWIKKIMEEYGELYTAYEWHSIDPEARRIIVYMQNRRDHPAGHGTIDFPGITVLHYAGDGLFDAEEDFWSVPGARAAAQAYAEACERHDPDHPHRRTRLNWGEGPDWTRGAPSYFERPSAR
ncbi:MAG: nuclear transport factor 2 family protein [Myxococcota bacterium]